MTSLPFPTVAYGRHRKPGGSLPRQTVGSVWLNQTANHGKYGVPTDLPWVYTHGRREAPKPTAYRLRGRRAITC